MLHWLDPQLTTLAFCWRLARRDGVVLGFTSHDHDLELGGLIYRAAPGMVPSAIEKNLSFSPDSVDLSGVLTSDAITASDLIAGRWDEASLTLYAVDWTAPDTDPVQLVRGTLGSVRTSGESFEAELRGPTSVLDAPVVEATSPDCRAELGDARCRIDLAGRRLMIATASVTDSIVTVSTVLDPGIYGYGRLRWIEGANAGLSAFVLANDATTVTLAEPPRRPVLSGDRAEITEGCDRRFSTCVVRFGNALNFRGEPLLPGNDLLTRYAS